MGRGGGSGQLAHLGWTTHLVLGSPRSFWCCLGGERLGSRAGEDVKISQGMRRVKESEALWVVGAKGKFSFLPGTLRFGAACGGRARVLGVTSEPLSVWGALSKGVALVFVF